MWVLLLPLIPVLLLIFAAIALFMALPVKFGIVAAVICFILAGAIVSWLSAQPFH